VLRRATGKSISALTEEWLWRPMGAKDLAHWHVASTDKAAAASGGFNASLRAYGRLGMFLLCRVFMGRACWYNQLTKLYFHDLGQPQAQWPTRHAALSASKRFLDGRFEKLRWGCWAVSGSMFNSQL
jgi:CubicO group peptidase (beta-lactamase class C family)